MVRFYRKGTVIVLMFSQVIALTRTGVILPCIQCVRLTCNACLSCSIHASHLHVKSQGWKNNITCTGASRGMMYNAPLPFFVIWYVCMVPPPTVHRKGTTHDLLPFPDGAQYRENYISTIYYKRTDNRLTLDMYKHICCGLCLTSTSAGMLYNTVR